MDFAVRATDEEDRPLPVAGFKGTPEEIERQWYEQVFRGHGDSMAQLTWRAVLVGSCLGSVLSLTNLYIGLKAGWGFGVAITACILSYAIWTGLLKVGLARTPMTILENNCMQSTASSAGYSTGGTLVSAFAAYIIINHQSMSVPLMLAWVFFIAVLGVTMAIPMKRQMINIEQLRFPSGIAAAETLRALHAKSSQGLRAAKALGLAGLIAAIDKFWAEGLSTIDASLERFSSGALLTGLQKWLLGGHYDAWAGRSVVFSWDFIFLAAGAITGMRVCATMFVSGTLLGGGRAGPPGEWRHRRCGLRRHRAMDALVRRILHGGRRTVELCAELAHGIKRVPRPWANALLALGAGKRSAPHRGANELVCCRPDRVACCTCLARSRELRHAGLGKCRRGGAVVSAGAGRLSRHGRDRYDACRRNG
jgi:hypothetical protein